MPALQAETPIQYVKGVGPRRAALFASLKLHTVADLLDYAPWRYELDSGAIDIEDLRPGAVATIGGEVTRLRHGPAEGQLRADVTDGTGDCLLRWFHRARGDPQLYVGGRVIATGDVRAFNDRIELVQPRVRVYAPDQPLPDFRSDARRVAAYRGNPRIRSSLIRRIVLNVLSQPRLPITDIVPQPLLRRRKLLPRDQAVRQLHNPGSETELVAARRRLAYDEFLLMELAMALRRQRRVALQRGQKLRVTPEIDQRIRARFPFTLTKSQDAVLADIRRDLASGRPMTRLIQGDVGSGKTVVALYACLAAVAHGGQAAIMAPTEILARQHFLNIEKYLAGSRVRRALLRGGMGRKAHDAALAAAESGELDLVVGTQALIQKDVAFRRLSLVVVDEQHKFGVMQRANIRTKGPQPHYLVMTATPIPRTLSMTVFGDLDCSIIRHSPPGRGRIITKVVRPGQWDTVMRYVRGRLEQGEQAYVVCPLIGGPDQTAAPPDTNGEAAPSAPKGAAGAPQRRGVRRRDDPAWTAPAGPRDAPALRSVHEAHAKLAGGPWKGLNVALLYGGMPAAEKRRVIDEFNAGGVQALVSTTVVEVGVDVPNATIMVVEHAERFGLSQLHQLRGRVGRGARDSLCVFIGYDPGAPARERLDVLAATTDGFRIAEADLRLRGPGELFGTRQHGLPELRYGNLVADFAILEEARQDAFAIVAADPTLGRPEHAALLPALRKMFGEKLALIDAA